MFGSSSEIVVQFVSLAFCFFNTNKIQVVRCHLTRRKSITDCSRENGERRSFAASVYKIFFLFSIGLLFVLRCLRLIQVRSGVACRNCDKKKFILFYSFPNQYIYVKKKLYLKHEGLQTSFLFPISVTQSGKNFQSCFTKEQLNLKGAVQSVCGIEVKTRVKI